MKKRFKVVRASARNKINKQIKAVFITVLIIVALAAVYLIIKSEESVLLAPSPSGLSLSNSRSLLSVITNNGQDRAALNWLNGNSPTFKDNQGNIYDSADKNDLKNVIGNKNFKKVLKELNRVYSIRPRPTSPSPTPSVSS